MINGETAAHVWADRFDIDRRDLAIKRRKRRGSVDRLEAQACTERGLPGHPLLVGGANHFTILETLANPRGALTRALFEMIGG